MLCVLLLALGKARSPKYNIQIVSNPNDINTDEYTFEIPGHENHGLLCSVSETVQKPKGKIDPVSLLSPYEGKCSLLHGNYGLLKVCFGGEVTLNNSISLGFMDEPEVLNESVRYVTANGDVCTDEASWAITLDFQCDNTANPNYLWIPIAWQEEEEPCMFKAIVKTRLLCKSKLFSHDCVTDVKCIPRALLPKTGA